MMSRVRIRLGVHHTPSTASLLADLDRLALVRDEHRPLAKDRLCSVYSLAFSPDRKLLAADERGDFLLWPIPSGDPITLPADDTEDTYAVAFAPSGHTLAVARRNK